MIRILTRTTRFATLAVLLAVAVSSCANPHAAAPYETVRDEYQRSLATRLQLHEDVSAADDSAIHDLEARLRPIVGDFAAPFVTGSGRINLQTLLPGEMTSGLPDGIVYWSADSATRVFVTTQSLIRSWIPRLFAKDASVSSDPRVALTDPAVLTQIFDADAAVQKYADIPVDSGRSVGLVSAMLVARAQDYCRCQANEIIVSVMRGPRVFIIDAPARDTLGIPEACTAAADAGAANAKSIVDSAIRSNPRDTALLTGALATDSVTDATFRRCYGEHASHEPGFGALVGQVHQLVRSLPLR